MHAKNDYIVVMDSGIGGLSVLGELFRLMPRERFLYYGDTANAPYGDRSTQQVQQLTLEAVDRAIRQVASRNVKALVVACNTATAAAINALRAAYPDLIVIGIEPALKLAADNYPTGTVGVLATSVTLREEKFAQLARRFPALQLEKIPLPGLVERIEAGCSEELLEAFLQPLLSPYAGKLDAAVLGCTHYPFARNVIQRLLGSRTAILDGGEGTARQTLRQLQDAGLINDGVGELVFQSSKQDKHFLSRCQALLSDKINQS